MNDSKELKSLSTYFDLMVMNGSLHIFETAKSLKIFSAIAKGLQTLSEIAHQLDMQEKPLALLMNGLCALNLVELHDDKYTLTPVMKLLSGDYENLGDVYWKHLPEYLVSGKPIVSMDDKELSENHYVSQVMALDWMMRPSAHMASSILQKISKKKRLRILDVGAGSGIWSITLAKSDESIEVTALDWPAILKITQQFAEQAGIQKRFKTIPGDYHSVEIPQNHYDLVIIGNVTHIETPESNISLFTKLKYSLKKDGELLIIDVFPGQEKGEMQKALYEIGLALRTENGKVYSPDELKKFMSNSGYCDFQINSIPATPYTMGMLIGKVKKEM